jgi:hypothetical protein
LEAGVGADGGHLGSIVKAWPSLPIDQPSESRVSSRDEAKGYAGRGRIATRGTTSKVAGVHWIDRRRKKPVRRVFE